MERLITDTDRRLCESDPGNGGLTPGPDGMQGCEREGKEYQTYLALAWAEKSCHGRAVFEGYRVCEMSQKKECDWFEVEDFYYHIYNKHWFQCWTVLCGTLLQGLKGLGNDEAGRKKALGPR